MAGGAQRSAEEHIPKYVNCHGLPENALGRKETENVQKDTIWESIQTDTSEAQRSGEECIPKYVNCHGLPENALGRKETENVQKDTI